MGMNCTTIEMCQLPDCRGNSARISAAVDDFLNKLKHERGASQNNQDYFGIVILNRANEYPDVKKVFSRLGVLT